MTAPPDPSDRSHLRGGDEHAPIPVKPRRPKPDRYRKPRRVFGPIRRSEGRCRCSTCDGAVWPAIYVGNAGVDDGPPNEGISWECYVLLEQLPTAEPVTSVDVRTPRGTRRVVSDAVASEEHAREAGLSVRRRGRETQLSGKAGQPCEHCGRRSQRRRRYCAACEQLTWAALVEEGWTWHRIEAWIGGADWPLECDNLAQVTPQDEVHDSAEQQEGDERDRLA